MGVGVEDEDAVGEDVDVEDEDVEKGMETIVINAVVAGTHH